MVKLSLEVSPVMVGVVAVLKEVVTLLSSVRPSRVSRVAIRRRRWACRDRWLWSASRGCLGLCGRRRESQVMDRNS